MPSAWTGDWKKRVAERASQLGFSSVMAVFRAHPDLPFGQIFRMLRETESENEIPMAYIQLQTAYFEEADREGILQEALAALIVRLFKQFLPSGWNRGKRIRERQGKCWCGIEVPLCLLKDGYSFPQEFWKAIEELHPPDDWCPEDANDPILQKAIDRAWLEDA